ncbi:ABC transporter permease [Microlunatus panaciterrae]|uniref:Peptide/nickel transport system permease protein n=1 Tax=Microlunatus panaciterrae TaxID=400768 RepID=A0ABS2RGF5_9ACTN|nr:ABC transporter permease [Microlunatus panaciterrae]MBM7798090.1 peptide/nickel transport system permease protein [Microlunatus panaciterrae]
MGKYLLRRIVNYVILLFIAVTLAYFLAASALHPRALYEVVNPPIDPVSIENSLREKNLSDQVPLIQRWWTWFTGVLHGDWGQAPRGGEVADEIGRRMWVSLRLVTLGSLIGIVGGVAIGAWTATRQYKASDRVVTAASLLLLAMPTFVVATILMILATKFNQATGLRVFEFIGETGDRGSYPLAGLVDRIQHLFLPTLALSAFGIASFSRIQRNLMLDTLGADFVRTARAKGLRKQKAVMKHALRTSLIPTGTYFAFSVATLFTGATVMELIFTFHGMGIYGVTTIQQQDVHGAVAVVAFSGVCVLVGAILADIMVAILDPRVRLS